MTYQLYPDSYEAGFDASQSPEFDEFFFGATAEIIAQDREAEAEKFFAARDIYMAELNIHPTTVLSLCSDSGDIVIYFNDDTVMFFDSESVDGNNSFFVDSTHIEHATQHSFERWVMFGEDHNPEPENKPSLDAPSTIDEHTILQAVLAAQAMRSTAKQRGIEITTHGVQLLKGNREHIPLRPSTQLEQLLVVVREARNNESATASEAVGALASKVSIVA